MRWQIRRGEGSGHLWDSGWDNKVGAKSMDAGRPLIGATGEINQLHSPDLKLQLEAYKSLRTGGTIPFIHSWNIYCLSLMQSTSLSNLACKFHLLLQDPHPPKFHLPTVSTWKPWKTFAHSSGELWGLWNHSPWSEGEGPLPKVREGSSCPMPWDAW